MLPAFALAGGITLNLSKSTAKAGDTVTASGTSEPGAGVFIKMVNSSGNIIFSLPTKADEESKYTMDIVVPETSGVLTVVAGEGSNVASKTLTVGTTISPPSVSPGGGGGGSTPQAAVPVAETVEVAPVEGAALLNDLNGHWAAGSISKLVAMGCISGYPDGSFKPDKTITRAEFATILIKAFKLTPVSGKVFADTASHWARDNIAAAAASGIVSGYNGDTFGPDDLVTREQMAVLVVKAANLSPAAGESHFADSGSISGWARTAVATATENGVLKGYPDNTVRPRGSATRGEAVTVIVGVLNR